jgi:purine-nucleoside phosphorylase
MKPGNPEGKKIKAAVKHIKARTQLTPSVGIVLGSGMGAFGERLSSKEVFFYGDIPGFPVSGVPGHSGHLLIGHLGAKRLAVLQGRCHLYEGYTAAQVAFPIRILAELGVKVLIVTSAAGAVSTKLSPGDVMLVQDHLNFTGDNPLRGLWEEDRSVFVDMTSAYDASLMALAGEVAGTQKISCQRGTLASVLGPSYETPAEVAMLRSMGADAVCMSAVPEVIMANYMGLRVLGLVLITNKAADQTQGPETSGHKHVLEVAREKTHAVSQILERVVETVSE